MEFYSADGERILLAGAFRDGSKPTEVDLPGLQAVGDGFCSDQSSQGRTVVVCTSHDLNQGTLVMETSNGPVDFEHLQRTAHNLRVKVFCITA